MKKSSRLIFIASLLFFSAQAAVAQDTTAGKNIDINKIQFQKSISSFVSSAYLNSDENPVTAYAAAKFSPGLKHKYVVPNKYVTKKLLLKFTVSNSADTTIAIYFFPGFYYKEIELYKEKNNTLEKLPVILPGVEDSIGFHKFILPAKDSTVIVAELSFIKTYNNTIRPRLINSNALSAYIAEHERRYSMIDMTTYILCGLLLMMILFSLANFFQGANKEFLYYSGYAFFLGLMLFLMALYNFRANAFSYFLEEYLDFILQMMGIIFYMLFMRRFLTTKIEHPFLYKTFNAGLVISIISVLLYSSLHYFTNNFIAEYLTENLTKVILLLIILIFLVYSAWHWKDKLLRYLFWGNLCLLIFSIISQLSAFMQDILDTLPGIFSSSVFYYEIGLFLELVFFLSGLNYKNNKRLIAETKERETLKAKNQMQEYEKEIAVYKAQQEERERISADMHDELGSGMTAIRLMSEIARNKMKENTPVEIEKISRSANDVLNKMNAIIWSMNSGNDTLDNLISYIRSYALEYFDGTPVDCKINAPEIIPEIEITGDKRRNIFLCLKESLNNALKHSNASQIIIDIEINSSLKIVIADNGIGIDLQSLRKFGNGLKNIGRRMESIGGTFAIENNNGTITTLDLPL